MGEHAVALTPWGYATGSALSLVVFARTRNFAFLRMAQLLLILVAPALGTVMLGGLRESSAVILWSLFAPLGAVVFDRPGRAWAWFAAFVATILLALVLSEVVRPDGADLPEGFVRTFDVLNIVVVSFVAMLLLVSFARGRDAAQARVEALLLNVLPADVAQRLQSDPNSIADYFDEVSILFADVVDFTPLASGLDPREVVGLAERALLVTQSHHRIDPCGPPGRYGAGRERDSSHQHGCHTVGDRIVWCNPVEKARQQTAQNNCRCQTKSEARQSERHPFAQDEAENRGHTCAERHPDADFARSLPDCQRQHSVKSNRGQQQTQTRCVPDDTHGQRHLCVHVLNESGQRHRLTDSDVGIDSDNLLSQQRQHRAGIALHTHQHAS